MNQNYKHYTVRDWQPQDRQHIVQVIATVLAEYNLEFEPDGTDQDACQVEDYYWQTGGEFWVIETGNTLVGSGGYLPIERGEQAVEIRKMYLLPQARGQGLGKFLLTALERAISQRGFQTIWVETASVLKAAVGLYETLGYTPSTEVSTPRCDLVYVKSLRGS